MTEPRFRTLSPEQWTPEQRRVAEALAQAARAAAVRGPYVPLIHSPELADRMRHLGDFIRFEGVLPPRLRRSSSSPWRGTGRSSSCSRSIAQMSAELGIDRAIVDAIAQGRRPAELTPQEAAAYDAARELAARRADRRRRLRRRCASISTSAASSSSSPSSAITRRWR